jgi:hypothetical protein
MLPWEWSLAKNQYTPTKLACIVKNKRHNRPQASQRV